MSTHTEDGKVTGNGVAKNASNNATMDVSKKDGGTDRYAKIKSKSRHESQNVLLSGFVNNPNATAKEVAYQVLKWSREGYCNAQKRAYDLCSDRLAYLEKTGERQCLMSKALSSVYVITERGRDHLQKLALKLPNKVGISGGELETKVVDNRTTVAAANKIQAEVQSGSGTNLVVKVVKSTALGPTESLAKTDQKVAENSSEMPANFLKKWGIE